MKDPVGVFGCRRGFVLGISGGRCGAMRIGLAACRCLREQIAPFGLLSGRGAPMPPWLELLLNVIAFAGFIGIAKYHKSRSEKLPDR
jgi:hypothetical protein